MSLIIQVTGKVIAHDLRPAPVSPTPTPKSPIDLLVTSGDQKECAMWRTAVQVFANLRKVPLQQLTFEALMHGMPWFKHELLKSHYKRNSARSYCNYVSRFVAHATALGWSPAHSEIAEAWKPILAVAPENSQMHIRYAIAAGIMPAEFGDSVLERSAEEMLACGRSYRTTITSKNLFRRIVAESGLQKLLPRLSPPSKKLAKFPRGVFPPQLKAELEYVLQQKQKQYAPGRGKRIRPITAANARNAFSRFISYALNLPGCEGTSTLSELFKKELVVAYIDYLINERGLESYAVCSQLRQIHASFKCHPDYKTQDFGWLPAVIAESNQESPQTTRDAIRERKLQKYQDFEVFLSMRDKMGVQMNEAEKMGGSAAAWLAHDRLVIEWWLAFLWRQRNIRECELGKNVFRASIPKFVDMSIPSWVRDVIKASPSEPIWQIHFPGHQTKTNQQIRAVVPRRLVHLLEEYLAKYRPILVRSADPPKTLFLNQSGGPMNSGQFSSLISKLTLEYTGRRTTPHLIRDIFAFWWLRHHPQDYLTLSKVLWHSNLQTTINSYASKFDESAALCRVEEYLDHFDQKFAVQLGRGTTVKGGNHPAETSSRFGPAAAGAFKKPAA